MTTIKSLKDMYVKLGGSLTDTYADIAGGKAVGTYATIPEMIQACTKKASGGGGGSDLPEHTVADNGKFLGVVEGDLAWAEAGGGEEPFYVTFTVTNPEGLVIGGVDKTYAEVAAADEAGKRLIGRFVYSYEGQEIEMLKTDIAASFYLENGKTYIWQCVYNNEMTSILYDIQGYQVMSDELNKEAVFYTFYNITDIATSDLSCDDTAKTLYEKYQGKQAVRARVSGDGINNVFFDLAYAHWSGDPSDPCEIEFTGTYLDGTSLVWLKIHHESTGGNEAFALTKKTIETV